jgi:hypothetical protein
LTDGQVDPQSLQASVLNEEKNGDNGLTGLMASEPRDTVNLPFQVNCRVAPHLPEVSLFRISLTFAL